MYVCICIPVRTLLVYVYFRNRHQIKTFLHVSKKKFIGIKSLNTKQCAARSSPPPVKLSGFD